MAVTEEPIISRIDRLDNMLKQLEEIRGSRSFTKASLSSSGASTPSSRDGHASLSSGSTADYNSPKGLHKHCRPIELAIMETEAKGTLVDRLDHIEDHLIKMEVELEAEREREQKVEVPRKKEKKGFKHMVKKLVKGGTREDVQPSVEP